MTSGALALATTTGTLMSWAQSHLPDPGSTSRVQVGAFGGCGELPFVGQSMAVGIGAEITIPYHRRPFGRAHRFAEPFQQRRRAGHAQIPQQPARRERGAPEGAAQVEVSMPWLRPLC